jgi:hypothetical protein
MLRAFGIEVPWSSARAAKADGMAVSSLYEMSRMFDLVNVLVEKISRNPRIVQVPLSVLGVETDSALSCADTSTADPTELLLLSAANSFLSCSIS